MMLHPGEPRPIRVLVLLALLACAALPVRAQIPEVRRTPHETTLRPKGISNLAPKAGIPLEAARSTVDAFLLEVASELGLTDPARQLTVAQAREDQVGQTHVVYHQVHQGLRVVNASVRVHLNPAGEVYLAHGKVVEALPTDITPSVSMARAMETAEYAARDLLAFGWEPEIPEPELVILPVGISRNLPDPDPRLAWQVHVQFPMCKTGDCESLGAYVSVDAKTGEVLFAVQDFHGLNRQVYDCAKQPGDTGCYLDSPGLNGYIHGRSEGQPDRGPHNNPALPQYGSTDVDTAYAFAGRIHAWVQASFGLNGANNLGGTRDAAGQQSQTRFIVHAEGPSYNGASFCPGGGYIGATYSIALCHSEVFEDIVGHEYGHALSDWSFAYPPAGLGTPGVDRLNPQVRALSESHSDIMGEAFELNQTGSADWQSGTGSADPDDNRHLADPNSSSSPGSGRIYAQRFYDPNFNCDTSSSTDGFYFNSTVYSHAMYLAAEGGELNGCDIQGQGMEFAKQIFFRAFRTYFDRSQGFATAHTKLLQACNDLYTPQQCEELEKALQAVEADQVGRCWDPLGTQGVQAPPCAVNHTGLAQTTRSDQTPTTEFPVGWEVWLHLANATPNQTLDFQLLPHDPAREIWEETASLALETTSGTVLPDGSLSAPFFVPTLEDTFDVLVDGNRDGHYQPWADTLLTITVISATGTPDLPRPATMLRSVRPNPTRGSARIAYTLQEPAQVDLAIYDVAGRLVRTLSNTQQDAGVYELTWDGTDASGRPTGTGLYFIKLMAGDTVDTRKLVRVR